MKVVCIDAWYRTSLGGLYHTREDGWAFKADGVGAHQIAPADVEIRVWSGEWVQVINPRLTRTWPGNSGLYPNGSNPRRYSRTPWFNDADRALARRSRSPVSHDQ